MQTFEKGSGICRCGVRLCTCTCTLCSIQKMVSFIGDFFWENYCLEINSVNKTIQLYKHLTELHNDC